MPKANRTAAAIAERQAAQVAKQAKDQIAYNAARGLDTRPSKGEVAKVAKAAKRAPGDATPGTSPEYTAHNKAKRAAADEAAAKAMQPALDKARATPPKAAKPLAKGSGALVGVAQGACDHAPHTRLAVEQARKRLAAEAKADPLVVDGVRYPNASRAGDARLAKLAAEAIAASPKATPPKTKAQKVETKVAAVAKAKATKAARAPTPKGARSYKPGPNTYNGKPGSWTAYMVQAALQHADTQAATEAHQRQAAKAGQPANKPLDFKWMDAKGYIAFA